MTDKDQETKSRRSLSATKIPSTSNHTIFTAEKRKKKNKPLDLERTKPAKEHQTNTSIALHPKKHQKCIKMHVYSNLTKQESFPLSPTPIPFQKPSGGTDDVRQQLEVIDLRSHSPRRERLGSRDCEKHGSLDGYWTLLVV